MMRVKRSERGPFIFIVRLNIVLQDSYQAAEIVKDIEEWKQKVPGNYVKSFKQGFIKCVGDIYFILKKLYYMNLTFDYS